MLIIRLCGGVAETEMGSQAGVGAPGSDQPTEKFVGLGQLWRRRRSVRWCNCMLRRCC
jgi:hypothetical protein